MTFTFIMNPELKDLPLVKTEKRFELVVDGKTAFIDYTNKDDKLYLIHTEVPTELTGRGIGTVLIEKTLKWLDENHVRYIPICPIIRKYLLRNG